MPAKDPKREALRQQGVLNPRPGDITDQRFAVNSFFDPRDLVQVKYEMLRRVQAEGHSITQAAAAFGFSRPCFYQAQAAFAKEGLAGLVPRKRGPKQAHKLTRTKSPVRTRGSCCRVSRMKSQTSSVGSTTLWHHGASTKYHARVVAASKKTSLSQAHDTPAVRPDLVAHYGATATGGYRRFGTRPPGMGNGTVSP
jgi:hypothetical protein